MAGRGISALRHLPDAPSRPTFGRGRARFSSAHLDDDETAMALLRRQLETFAQAPLTPDTPGPSSTAAYGQFDDHPSDAGTMTPHSPGNTSGAATPRRRPRCASEASSSLVSTPRSSSSYNFRGDDDPDCVCYREKKQVHIWFSVTVITIRLRKPMIVSTVVMLHTSNTKWEQSSCFHSLTRSSVACVVKRTAVESEESAPSTATWKCSWTMTCVQNVAFLASLNSIPSDILDCHF